MSSKDISWANVADSAWAAQTVKHNGKYYFYYCTWDKTAKASSKIKAGEQSIGVAVSDSPTGPVSYTHLHQSVPTTSAEYGRVS